MKDYLEIGPSPVNEDCVQLGSENYRERAIAECRRFINQLRAQFGPEPDGARLYVKSNSHDFGTYFEVACEFDTEKPDSQEYAYRLEAEAWENWK